MPGPCGVLLALLCVAGVSHAQQTLVANNTAASAPCGEQYVPDASCVWTGSCPITGCENKCVINLGTGFSRDVLEDRAYGEYWYALCPRLAQIIAIVSREIPSPTGPGEDTELSLSTEAMFNRRRLLLDLSPLDWGQWTPGSTAAQQLAAVLQPRRQHRDYRFHRALQQDDAAAPAPVASSTRQVCPDPEEVNRLKPYLFALASDLEAIFIADATGQPLTATQSQLSYILDQPNEFAFLIRYMKDADALVEYMADSCATAPIPAQAFPLFSRYFFDDSQPTTAQLTVCRDTFGGMESHIAGITAIGTFCETPFAQDPDAPVCFLGEPRAPWTPTNEQCALALSRAYNVSDAPLRATTNAVTSLHELCLEATAEADCAIVNGTPQQTAIDRAWDAFPLPAGYPGANATAPVEAAPLDFGAPPAPAEGPVNSTEAAVTPIAAATQGTEAVAPASERSGAFGTLCVFVVGTVAVVGILL